jgi:hypothetical protein
MHSFTSHNWRRDFCGKDAQWKSIYFILLIWQRRFVSLHVFDKEARFHSANLAKAPKKQIGFFFINFLYILKRNFTKKQSVCEQLDPRPTYQTQNYSAADAVTNLSELFKASK